MAERIFGGNSGIKLESRHVAKPWGRKHLPGVFTSTSTQPTGEVWFISEDPSSLLAKYLFTAQNLSVQVHPDDEQAQSRGFPRGKAECWFVIDAEPSACIGLGLRCTVSFERLRAAALNGSVDELIAWHPVAPGDFFLVPPGTIHAIGAGISLLEVQQNSNVTYRLFDYGRGRDLHIDDGVAVARCERYPEQLSRHVDPSADAVLADGPYFTLLHSRCDALQHRERFILPIEGYAAIDGEVALPGECLLIPPRRRLDAMEGRLMVAAAPLVEPIRGQLAA